MIFAALVSACYAGVVNVSQRSGSLNGRGPEAIDPSPGVQDATMNEERSLARRDILDSDTAQLTNGSNVLNISVSSCCNGYGVGIGKTWPALHFAKRRKMRN